MQPQQASIFTTIPNARVKLIRDGQATYSTNKITAPADAYNILNTMIGDDDREHLIVIMLDTKNQVICTHTAAIGTANSAITSAREIIRAALLSGAVGIVLGHNHPSGDPTPSAEDIRMTKRLQEAAKIIDINLLDHVIIGHNRFASLKERNLI